MGICESNLSTKSLENENSKKHGNKNLTNSKMMPLKKGTKNSQYSENISEKLSTSYEKDIIKNTNNHPHLEKYEPSLEKTSELNNTNFGKSEIISKSNGVEIIIRGQINSNCFNKENDFDNPSFMKLVKSNGGKILEKDKIDSNCQKENGILYDFEKDDISEIKSQSSLEEISNKNTLLNELNGIDTNNETKSEISKGKFTNYSLAHKELKLDRNNKFDKRSQYTTKTIRQKMNANKYLKGIFENKYNTQNEFNINNNIKKKPYNIQTFKPNKDLNKNNKYKYQSSSNNTNATITEKLTGSSISVSKNNEKNQNMVNNRDIITNISPS